jgi:drug/metabolite transporter (DMT)-like permease
MPNIHSVFAGRALMVASMALYVANDAVMKLLGGRLPLGQMLFLRGLFMIALLLALVLPWRGLGAGALKWITHRAVLVRSGWDTLVTFAYLTALMHMPIANILAIINLAPLFILPMAARRLGERFRAADMLAVAAGLLGALIVVRPGPEGFNAWSLLAFFATLGIAARDVSTRAIPAQAPALVVTLANMLMVQAVAAVWWLMEGSAAVSATDWAMLALAAGLLSMAVLMLVLAVRAAPLPKTAPWRYSIIIWGVLAGWLVFGELPDALTLLGIGIIIASSIYATLREVRAV